MKWAVIAWVSSGVMVFVAEVVDGFIQFTATVIEAANVSVEAAFILQLSLAGMALAEVVGMVASAFILALY